MASDGLGWPRRVCYEQMVVGPTLVGDHSCDQIPVMGQGGDMKQTNSCHSYKVTNNFLAMGGAVVIQRKWPQKGMLFGTWRHLYECTLNKFRILISSPEGFSGVSAQSV